ncbi:hypothetical protein NC653_021106 [Populus alba x Populus x berolinensis]|uniref:Uncharacterized protein n=1 Tax=Populus alba x Populus x berolinensis TaxID=444605 RepID=A0AAD6MM59_9ROSI|nr:hypothetical protein NC653_021106 [Populus alba x Populus x berolinensis]
MAPSFSRPPRWFDICSWKLQRINTKSAARCHFSSYNYFTSEDCWWVFLKCRVCSHEVAVVSESHYQNSDLWPSNEEV